MDTYFLLRKNVAVNGVLCCVLFTAVRANLQHLAHLFEVCREKLAYVCSNSTRVRAVVTGPLRRTDGFGTESC